MVCRHKNKVFFDPYELMELTQRILPCVWTEILMSCFAGISKSLQFPQILVQGGYGAPLAAYVSYGQRGIPAGMGGSAQGLTNGDNFVQKRSDSRKQK